MIEAAFGLADVRRVQVVDVQEVRPPELVAQAHEVLPLEPHRSLAQKRRDLPPENQRGHVGRGDAHEAIEEERRQHLEVLDHEGARDLLTLRRSPLRIRIRHALLQGVDHQEAGDEEEAVHREAGGEEELPEPASRGALGRKDILGVAEADRALHGDRVAQDDPKHGPDPDAIEAPQLGLRAGLEEPLDMRLHVKGLEDLAPSAGLLTGQRGFYSQWRVQTSGRVGSIGTPGASWGRCRARRLPRRPLKPMKRPAHEQHEHDGHHNQQSARIGRHAHRIGAAGVSRAQMLRHLGRAVEHVDVLDDVQRAQLHGVLGGLRLPLQHQPQVAGIAEEPLDVRPVPIPEHVRGALLGHAEAAEGQDVLGLADGARQAEMHARLLTALIVVAQAAPPILRL
mmetsp:Transcript_16462/g.62570  ORF Transcript_16462/g.62570 Transcript_16462/m.62570 type:complete len:396 (+) Transcript_16462:2133-3320(+)|eukprot:scaffold1220_cov259-Pinguiococcus_pyrenoidosus.AAC.141